MMYSSNFVACIKVNGKILRESSNIVSLPFGSEYSILLKNLHSRRAMATVSVDGQNATEGTRLVIGPNATVELERFIKNGNMNSGNKFKFIERTGKIEEHRGIKADDGLVRVEFWAEKEAPKEVTETIIRRHYHDYYDPWWPWYPKPYYPQITWTCNSDGLGNGANIGNLATAGAQATSGMNQTNVSYGSSGQAANQSSGVQKSEERIFAMNMVNDTGITVAGSESNQQFHNVAGFPLETQSHVIVLQLRGEVAGKAVKKAVTVNYKPTCSICGRKNVAKNKFCADCGTALQLI
jgi:hypothetical protein